MFFLLRSYNATAAKGVVPLLNPKVYSCKSFGYSGEKAQIVKLTL